MSSSALFHGSGITGDLLRACDWSKSALGAPVTWPLSLRAHVRAMLNTRQPTCIFWGADYVNIYNDGFVPLLGEKHPRAMGQDARQVWSDAWPVVGELLEAVLARGEAVHFQEMRVPIMRGGQIDDAWWNYSYSPLFDDDGSIAGILVVATETTAEVRNRRQPRGGHCRSGGPQRVESCSPCSTRHRCRWRFSRAPTIVSRSRAMLPTVRSSTIVRSMGSALSRRPSAKAEVGYYLPLPRQGLRDG